MPGHAFADDSSSRTSSAVHSDLVPIRVRGRRCVTCWAWPGRRRRGARDRACVDWEISGQGRTIARTSGGDDATRQGRTALPTTTAERKRLEGSTGAAASPKAAPYACTARRMTRLGQRSPQAPVRRPSGASPACLRIVVAIRRRRSGAARRGAARRRGHPSARAKRLRQASAPARAHTPTWRQDHPSRTLSSRSQNDARPHARDIPPARRACESTLSIRLLRAPPMPNRNPPLGPDRRRHPGRIRRFCLRTSRQTHRM